METNTCVGIWNSVEKYVCVLCQKQLLLWCCQETHDRWREPSNHKNTHWSQIWPLKLSTTYNRLALSLSTWTGNYSVHGSGISIYPTSLIEMFFIFLSRLRPFVDPVVNSSKIKQLFHLTRSPKNVANKLACQLVYNCCCFVLLVSRQLRLPFPLEMQACCPFRKKISDPVDLVEMLKWNENIFRSKRR